MGNNGQWRILEFKNGGGGIIRFPYLTKHAFVSEWGEREWGELSLFHFFANKNWGETLLLVDPLHFFQFASDIDATIFYVCI